MKHIQPITRAARRPRPRQAWTRLMIGLAAFAAAGAAILIVLNHTKP